MLLNQFVSEDEALAPCLLRVCLCLCARSRGQYNTYTNNKVAKGSENSLKHVLKEILPLPLPPPLPFSQCLYLPKLAYTMNNHLFYIIVCGRHHGYEQIDEHQIEN